MSSVTSVFFRLCLWSCSTVKLVDLACLLFVPSCDLFYLLRYLGIFPVGDTFQSQPEAKQSPYGVGCQWPWAEWDSISVYLSLSHKFRVKAGFFLLLSYLTCPCCTKEMREPQRCRAEVGQTPQIHRPDLLLKQEVVMV